ncbi:MAG TPA: radical SAM protein [Elusimicrobiales bacterium]|nr:radical SAM protein [Elusimicrobiales bacterium]
MKAKKQARMYSSEKTKLESVVPLATPFSVHIDICSVCNLKCNFCFQADTAAIKQKGLHRGYMDFQLFKKIIDDSAEFKDKFRKVKIGLHGEPTLHPDLPRMISYLKSKNVTEVIEMFTNGTLLNSELNRKLIEAGLDRINISVEALTPEKYREITGVAIDTKKFVGNLKDLYENRKDCKIYVKIVDACLSPEDKEKFYATFGDICDEIFIENVVPQWADANKFGLGDTGMYGQKIEKYKHACPFLFMYLHFNHDGTASGCTLDWAREVLIGDVTKETVMQIWRGKKLKDLQIANLERKRGEIPFCAQCLAPMVCCDENLDPYAGELLKKIKG